MDNKAYAKVKRAIITELVVQAMTETASEEGVPIPPSWLADAHKLQEELIDRIKAENQSEQDGRNPITNAEYNNMIRGTTR